MKIIQSSGKRKRAIARATVKTGKGNVSINSVPASLLQQKYFRMKFEEAVVLSGDHAKHVDVTIRVAGGGVNGQAEAARIAYCRGLVAFTGNEDLKAKYLAYDRQLLVADVRRREAAKPNRHGKARSKVQKSYR